MTALAIEPALLPEVTGQTLLTTHAALTHRIHEATHAPITCHRLDLEADLRAQRDLVAAEILRRMGDQA